MSPNTRTAVKTLFALFGFAAVVLAVDTDYKTKIITSATLTIRVKDGQFLTIRNFTQDQDSGNGRGVIDAGLPAPSPTPTPTPTATSTPIPSPTPTSVDLIATKTDNAGGHGTFPNAWIWKIHIANRGNTDATFALFDVILTDNLPDANLTYGPPSVTNATANVTNSSAINCNISGSDLTCSANDTITIGAGGSFDVSFTVTPSIAGTFVNPRALGNCTVDPNNVITEADETNNTCSDTVSSSSPIPGTILNAGILTAALPGEFIKPMMIAGPATLTIDPVSGAKLTISYKKSLQPIPVPTSTPTPTP